MASSAVVGILRALLTLDSAQFDTGMKRAADSAKVFARETKQIGLQATQIGSQLTKTLTLPILGFGGAVAKAAIDFESSFAGIRKTVNASEAEFAQLAQGMRNLSKEIPINVNELNKIGEAAGQLGIKTQNILGFTKVIAQLGVTTNLSADQAASSLARLANITQMPQANFDRLGATIVALGNNLATTESEIVDFGLRIAGAGHLARMSEADILGIGAALSSVGVEAEAGGTAVQKVIIDMIEATTKGGKALDIFAATAGMTAQQFKDTFQGDAAKAFLAFVEGLGRQGQEGIRTLDALGLSDQRLVRSFLALAGANDQLRRSLKLSEDGWRQNTALSQEAERRFATTASQLTLLWNRVKDLGITLGNALLPTIQDAIRMLDRFIPLLEQAANAFAALPAPVRNTAVGVGLLLAALGPMIYVFGQIVLSASAVAGAFTKKGIAMRAIMAIAGPFIAAMRGIVTSTGLLGAAARGAVAAFWPLAAAIAAVWAAWEIGNIETVKTSIAQWALSADNLTAKLYRAVLGLKQMTPEEARQAVAATNAAIATKKHADAMRDLADAQDEATKNRLSGADLEAEVQRIQRSVIALNQAGKMSPDVWRRTAAELKNLQDQGAKLPPLLQLTVDSWGQTTGAMTTAAVATTTLSAELAAARKELAGLSVQQRANIAAGLELGVEHKKIAESVGVSEAAVKLFADAQRDATQAAKDGLATYKTLTDALAGTRQKMAALTVDQRAEIKSGLDLGLSTDDIAKKMKIGAAVVDLYATSLKNATDFAQQLADTNREVTRSLAEQSREFAERRESDQLDQIRKLPQAQREAAKVSDDIATRRAEHDIEMAKRTGANWKQIYAMERALSAKKRDAAIADAQAEFDARTADVQTRLVKNPNAVDRAELEAEQRILQAHIDQINEDFNLGEQEKQDALRHTYDIWVRTWDNMRAAGANTLASISDAVANMLTGSLAGARTFKDEMLDMWRSIQRGIQRILAEILDYFLRQFLAGLIKGIAGAKLGQTLGNAIAGGMPGGGGGAGGIATGVAQTAAQKYLGGLLGGGAGLGGSYVASEVGGVAAAATTAATTGYVGSSVAATEAAVYGGGGFMGGAGALLTNPYTAIAAGAVIGGTLLYRHLTRGKRGNDVRDKDLAQFAGFDTASDKADTANPPGFHGLDRLLTKYKKHDLFGPFVMAKDPGAVRKAFAPIQSFVGTLGRQVKSFQFGGFIPPGVVQPAILHGPEWVIPQAKMGGNQAVAPAQSHATVNFNINAVDAAGVQRLVRSREFIYELRSAMKLNHHGVGGTLRYVTTGEP